MDDSISSDMVIIIEDQNKRLFYKSLYLVEQQIGQSLGKMQDFFVCFGKISKKGITKIGLNGLYSLSDII